MVNPLRLAERPGEAAPVIQEALNLYEQKGNVVSAGKARALLGELETRSEFCASSAVLIGPTQQIGAAEASSIGINCER
jgi:hypothetical protein